MAEVLSFSNSLEEDESCALSSCHFTQQESIQRLVIDQIESNGFVFYIKYCSIRIILLVNRLRKV